MYKELKSVVERGGQALSCSFNNEDEMLIHLSKDADRDEFIKSLIRFTLDEAISTGENQMFLFSSPGHRDAFQNKMLDLAGSLGEGVDNYGFLSSGANISFILTYSRTSGGCCGHAYALNCFDDKPFDNTTPLMMALGMRTDRRVVFISTELKS